MSSELMVRDDVLDRHAETIRHEIVAAEAAAFSWLEHAIRAGESLTAAKQMVPDGGWLAWVKRELDISHASVNFYMRVFAYRHQLPQGEPLKRTDVVQHLRFLAPLDRNTKPEWMQDEARRMRNDGETFADIADHLGVNVETVRRWLNPKLKEQQLIRVRDLRRRQRAAERALRQKERDDAVKRYGGDVAEFYSQAIRLAQAIDQASRNTDNVAEAAALREARDQQYKVRDMLWQYVSTR